MSRDLKGVSPAKRLSRFCGYNVLVIFFVVSLSGCVPQLLGTGAVLDLLGSINYSFLSLFIDAKTFNIPQESYLDVVEILGKEKSSPYSFEFVDESSDGVSSYSYGDAQINVIADQGSGEITQVQLIGGKTIVKFLAMLSQMAFRPDITPEELERYVAGLGYDPEEAEDFYCYEAEDNFSYRYVMLSDSDLDVVVIAAESPYLVRFAFSALQYAMRNFEELLSEDTKKASLVTG
ncbi:hypothetical protein [Halodesulfovibrio sp.]|uniref:hypothetical protein n=1 Tax=Halodesulfovibrio sp. TaxID=1912772 RepID=UPI0025BB859F|nr:hypothetical protein [Halodesulfovibrio sp.]